MAAAKASSISIQRQWRQRAWQLAAAATMYPINLTGGGREELYGILISSHVLYKET